MKTTDLYCYLSARFGDLIPLNDLPKLLGVTPAECEIIEQQAEEMTPELRSMTGISTDVVAETLLRDLGCNMHPKDDAEDASLDAFLRERFGGFVSPYELSFLAGVEREHLALMQDYEPHETHLAAMLHGFMQSDDPNALLPTDVIALALRRGLDAASITIRLN